MDSEIPVKVVEYEIQSKYEANLGFLAVLNGAFCNQDRVGDNTFSLRMQNLEWNMDFETTNPCQSLGSLRGLLNQARSKVNYIKCILGLEMFITSPNINIIVT